jgi:methylthioribulose-1-phosphate dehydratase
MRAEQLLVVDHEGLPESAGSPRPSAECLLHVELAKSRGANAVLHTHSVWNTLLSEHFAQRGAVDLEGFEILKGLAGNSTHAMTEYVPIIDNDQDMVRLAARMRRALAESAGAHAVLLRRHGLYTWGSTLAEAERHVEVLEFLFEVVGRSLSLPATEAAYGTVENS